MRNPRSHPHLLQTPLQTPPQARHRTTISQGDALRAKPDHDIPIPSSGALSDKSGPSDPVETVDNVKAPAPGQGVQDRVGMRLVGWWQI